MDFKAGDKVKIRKDLICGISYHSVEPVIEDMLQYAGKATTIKRIAGEGLYILSCDPEEWYWPEKTLLPLKQTIADEIRHMDDETMAKFLKRSFHRVFFHSVREDLILAWLRQEADD